MQIRANESYEWARVLGHLAVPLVALLLTGSGIAMRRFREQAGASWPLVEGHVQHVDVRIGRRGDHLKHAVITYSYFQDEYRSGEYTQIFLRERSAWSFAHALMGKNVPVHYNPRKPNLSTLRREELERLLPVKSENPFGMSE